TRRSSDLAEDSDGRHGLRHRQVGAEEVGTPAGQGEAVGEHPQPEVVVLLFGGGEHHHRAALDRGGSLYPSGQRFDEGADDARGQMLLPHLGGASLPHGADVDQQVGQGLVAVGDGGGAAVEGSFRGGQGAGAVVFFDPGRQGAAERRVNGHGLPATGGLEGFRTREGGLRFDGSRSTPTRFFDSQSNVTGSTVLAGGGDQLSTFAGISAPGELLCYVEVTLSG